MSGALKACTASDYKTAKIGSAKVFDDMTDHERNDPNATRIVALAYLDALDRELEQAVLDRFLAVSAAKRQGNPPLAANAR